MQERAIVLAAPIAREGNTMQQMPLRWKLRELLDEHDITPYRLTKESGLAFSTIYRITGGNTDALHGKTADAILSALHRLTGREYALSDLVEWVPEEKAAA